MRRGTGVLLVATLILGGCTSKRDDRADAAGDLTVGPIEASVTDVDCAQADRGHFFSAAATTTSGDILILGGELTAETSADIRGLDASTFDDRFVGADLDVTVSDGVVGLDGTFTHFDGPVQAGEVPGAGTLTCPVDSDPGGGFLVVEGVEVGFDIVTCVETDQSLEVRATGVTDDAVQSLTLSRTAVPSGWTDRVEAAGVLEAGTSLTVETVGEDEQRAVDVADGLFDYRSGRVTIGEVDFGEGDGGALLGSLDLTCGLRLDLT